MTSYASRLKKLMDEKSIDRTRLAAALGISYQAVRKVFENEGSFGSKNNLKAAEFFGVSPSWLATGDGEMFGFGGLLAEQPAPPGVPSALSPSALEIAHLFDLIDPADRVRRARAYNAATAAILDVLQEKPATAAAAPDQQKQSA